MPNGADATSIFCILEIDLSTLVLSFSPMTNFPLFYVLLNSFEVGGYSKLEYQTQSISFTETKSKM